MYFEKTGRHGLGDFAKLSNDVGGGSSSGFVHDSKRELSEKDLRILAYVVCKLVDPYRDQSNDLRKHSVGTQYEQRVNELITAKDQGNLQMTLLEMGVSSSLIPKWLNNIEACTTWASGRVRRVITALESARVPQARPRAEMLDQLVTDIETDGAYKAFAAIGYKATDLYSPGRMPEVRLYAVSMLFEQPSETFEKLFDTTLAAIGKRNRALCFMGLAEEKFGKRQVLLSSREADSILKYVDETPKDSAAMARYRKDI
jgi:hypothetical protein